MAALTPAAGNMTPFSTGDTITVTLNPRIRSFQLTSVGFDLSAITATVLPVGAQAGEVVSLAGRTRTAAISSTDKQIAMASVVLSNLPAGTGLEVGVFQWD